MVAADSNPRPQPCEGGIGTHSDEAPPDEDSSARHEYGTDASAALPRQKVSGHDSGHD